MKNPYLYPIQITLFVTIMPGGFASYGTRSRLAFAFSRLLFWTGN